MNSTTFSLSNIKKVPLKMEFALKSSVLETNEYKKGIFILSHESIELEPDQTEEIRVWAMPDAAQKFKDDLIIMIKDNPLPEFIPM